MREIINLIDQNLIEGVGLARRRPGEKFKNSQNDVVIFQGLYFFPERGNYKNPEQLADGLQSAYTQFGITPANVHWTNRATNDMLAFAIAHFTDEGNRDYYLGRYFRKISPNRIENNFPHDAIPGGFHYQSRTGLKEKSGYKPSEILTDFTDQSPSSIYQQIVNKFGTDSDEARATQAFMATKSFPLVIKKGKINFTAFRDYFCEMWQPMALVMGKPVTGNSQEAAEIFFGKGSGYSDCVINFNSNTTGGLYDSMLVNSEGKIIKLSSKGKDGASASAANLYYSMKELEKTPKGTKLLTQFDEEISILDIIRRVDARNGPLDLAIKFKIINPEEKSQILNLKGLGGQDKILGKKLLSPKLEKFYQSRTASDPNKLIPLDHMIAAVAYKVADYVNKNTKFSDAAAAILNHSAVVQMYTTAKEQGDNIIIQGFNAVYPSQTFTGVILDAQKVYYSTGNNGKYTFTILKNGAKPKDVEMERQQINTQPDAVEPGGVLEPRRVRPDIKASDTVKQSPKSDKSIYGRTRR